LKILYHHRTVSKDGIDVQLEEMTGAFAALGHDVILVPPKLGAREFGTAGWWASKLRPRLPRVVIELVTYAYNVLAFWRLARTIMAHQPDAIYERCGPFLMAGIWAKRLFKLPMALELNASHLAGGRFALRSLARRCERKAWRSADLCLPAGRLLAEVVKAAGVSERRIAVMPAAVDPSKFSPSLDDSAVRQQYGLDGKVVLGFVGCVQPSHGLDSVVQLVSDLETECNLHLLVVGDGSARASLVELANRLGVQDRLTFTGVVERAEIAAHMAAFDIALQPVAARHASPLRLVEYMALRKAIVAPDQHNVKDVLEHDRTAILFDRRAPDGLRQALLRLIADPELRERLGNAAAEEVALRPLTWMANADHVASMLKRMPFSSTRRSTAFFLSRTGAR